MAHTIRVAVPGADYYINLESGLLARLTELGSDGPIVVVSDSNVARLYQQDVRRALPDVPFFIIPAGESHKTLQTVAGLYTNFVSAGLDRSGLVIALGGGVVGDTVGFAAATYMRGVRFLQIPTTLLAMVDSSVGGKVGVDLPQGKNLVGAFKQPEAVWVDPEVLTTLPPLEWRCGMAEVVKHGLLADQCLLEPEFWVPDRAEEMITRAVQVKVDIVQQDPFEEGVRAYLNLGHTFAHAIEQVSSYRWLHGEAVSVGLVAAARLSVGLGLCPQDLSDRVRDVLLSLGLPVTLGPLDAGAIVAAMATDKKWRAGRSRFVALRAIGQPVLVDDVEPSLILHVLRSLKEDGS